MSNLKRLLEICRKYCGYILGLIAIIVFIAPSYGKEAFISSDCQSFVFTATSPDISDNYLLLLPNGSTDVYIWSLTNARTESILPFAQSIVSWRGRDNVIRSDTFRIPQISPDKQYITYATAYSQQDLSYSLQFIWATPENRIISSLPWHPNWIHAIGWIDENHLGFLAQADVLSIEIVNLQGVTTQTIPLNWLNLSIPSAPWSSMPYESSYFFLWSTFSPQSGNLLIWYRADEEAISRIMAINIYSQSLFFERGADEFITLQGGAMYQNPGGHAPAWSHSGERLAIPIFNNNTNEDLYILWDDGRLQPVISSSDSVIFRIVEYPVWSPNDRLVAYWVYETSSESNLYLFDVESERLINTSVFNETSERLFWSSDNRYLAFWDSSENILKLLNLDNCTIHQIRPHETDPFFNMILGWY